MTAKTVLIVDDEDDVLTYLSAFFRENGFEPVTAEDGKKAFAVAKAIKPDLITLDITMPEQSGLRTYRNFKKDDDLKCIPVIILTAIGDSIDVIIEQLVGFPPPEGFIGKPIDHDRLERLANALTAGIDMEDSGR